MKTRIITLLLAISAIVIGGAYAQTKIKVHKGGEVIYSVPLTDVDSVGFAKVSISAHNGHEFVDLGLPSGTKWATCNMGATAPEEFGNYYAWAETTSKDYYSWSNYKYCDGIGSRLTKYATGYSYSNAPDGLTELEMSDDVARVGWGGSWRIPTEEDMTELIVYSNWTWVTQNGISGYKVTSTVNGNSIFLPATGAKGDGYVSNQEYAYYWTNSIRDYVNNSANALYCLKAYAPTSTGNLTRCTGASVRAVCNIDGGNTQTKVSIYKEDDVIYSRPIAEIDSIKFAKDYNGGISTEKYYRIKNVETGLYMNAANYDFHYTGSYGGVNCVAYAQDADQIFKFEVSGDDYKLKTNSGYYLYCQQWIVDAQTAGVDLSFIKNDDETYDIMFGESYFAVDEVNGYYYPFCNATEGEKVTWVLEEATPLPTYTVSVSATEGGSASTSVNSMAHGGSATLFATPESGYRFVNWTVNGSEVSTENIFVATITANTEFIANFEKRTTDTGISLTKEYRIKDVASGCYLNIANNYIHAGGPYGGVNCIDYAENNNQIFMFEASGNNYYLKSKSGYYIYCQQWNVDGLTYGSELTFIDNPDGTYYIKNGANYFKVELVEGVYYPYCDAPADLRATWVLEQVGGEEPEPTPTYTVSVSATEGGTVTTSAESVEEGGSVILTATPETGYRFVNWTLNNNVVSVSNPFIATITANSEYVANFEKFIPQYVDLGLPSGIKWATCNVGATTPEGYGDYFAWGEITPKSSYTSENYTYNDNPAILPLSVDAANANWGGNWRMPTIAEQEELMDANNCTWEWTTQNGVNGYKVTSTKNGNSIFLPAAGYHYDDGLLDAGSYGHYWSSSLFESYTDFANCFTLNSYNVQWGYDFRYYAKSVRAVYEDSYIEPNIYTISVSATEGGSVTTSAESVEEGGSVILTATPETGYVFKNWTLGGEVVSTENPYTVTVTANSEFVANFEGVETEHEYVDLGLSVNWATCNVGANTPEEYGDYFAWGETSPKDYYYWSNYKYCYGDRYSMTKYCVDSEYGIVDNKTTLEPEDDAARVNWGGEWRMPTKAEQDELRNTDNCTWTWTTQNGVNGYKVTSKKNGNSIFLPAAGCRYESNLDSAGSYSYYGSSSLYEESGDYIYHLSFGSSGVYWGYSDRYYGLSVRPVCDSSTPAPTYTVAVSSTIGGTATASAESIKEGGSVTLTATANSGYEFVNWTLNGVVVSTENPYTATVTANSEFVANFEEEEQSGGLHNGYEYINLGLPSGLKWATCNVGATTPEGYGDYFAWGETETKEVYNRDTYTYTSTPSILPLSADAANANWGGKWRMPTGDEMEELMDTNNCTWEWTTQNGVNGYKVTSKKNGNSIFLPAAGERQNYGLDNEGSNGYYWSSSLDTSMSERSLYLNFADYGIHLGSLFFHLGMPVRAVYEASYIEPTMCTVSVSATEGGTATASASSVEQGGTVTLTATANSFCEFVNWTLNGEVVSTENPYTTSITANSEFVANFVEFETACLWYYISDDYSGSGYIEATLTSTGETLSSGRVFLAGSEVTLTATPYSDEDVFIRWELHKPNDEIIVITENPCTITVTEDSYIDAVFYSDPVSLSIVAEGGTITGGETLIERYDSVDLTATPNDGYAFVNWTKDGEVVSTKRTYSFMILEDTEIKANFIEYKKTGTHNNHDYVDLGLPSGIKWATYNVGATIPEENGDYFAWGETEPKATYDWSNYKYNGGEGYDGGVYRYFYSKYDDDDLYELESIDDAARVNWGDGWRMPNIDEMEELCNRDYCIWGDTIINEVRVYKVTSKTNGNYIFIPYLEGKSAEGENGRLTCTLWCKSLDLGSACPYIMWCDGGINYWSRYRGLQVRAVCTKGKEDVTPLPTYTVSVSATEGGSATTSATSVEQGESVTITAVPNEGYEFDKWVINDMYMLTDMVCTIRVEEDLEIVARFVGTANRHNGFEYVDLGLPSGTKWATCNVGAEGSQELGGYVAWGETSSKDSYTAENYTYSANPATLPLSADVANVYMGGNWRMPTEEEVQELIDYCTWSQTVSVSNLGARGHHVTSNINGAKIFIPATGYTQGSMLQPKQYITQIWTSSIDSEDNQYAKSMYVYGTGTRKVQSSLRYKGLPIRAVFRED